MINHYSFKDSHTLYTFNNKVSGIVISEAVVITIVLTDIEVAIVLPIFVVVCVVAVAIVSVVINKSCNLFHAHKQIIIHYQMNMKITTFLCGASFVIL